MNEVIKRITEARVNQDNCIISFNEYREIIEVNSLFTVGITEKIDDGYTVGSLYGSLLIITENGIIAWNNCKYCHTNRKPILSRGYVMCPKCGAPIL